MSAVPRGEPVARGELWVRALARSAPGGSGHLPSFGGAIAHPGPLFLPCRCSSLPTSSPHGPRHPLPLGSLPVFPQPGSLPAVSVLPRVPHQQMPPAPMAHLLRAGAGNSTSLWHPRDEAWPGRCSLNAQNAFPLFLHKANSHSPNQDFPSIAKNWVLGTQ